MGENITQIDDLLNRDYLPFPDVWLENKIFGWIDFFDKFYSAYNNKQGENFLVKQLSLLHNIYPKVLVDKYVVQLQLINNCLQEGKNPYQEFSWLSEESGAEQSQLLYYKSETNNFRVSLFDSSEWKKQSDYWKYD